MNLKQIMKKMKNNILLMDYMHLIKKIEKTKDKKMKRNLKQIKNNILNC